MNNIIKPTWKNILLCILLFYVVGDTLSIVKSSISQTIKDYKRYQVEKNYEEYLNSPEHIQMEKTSDSLSKVENQYRIRLNESWKLIRRKY
jgi:hypothetical protein